MHAKSFLSETSEIASKIDCDEVERLARALHEVRKMCGKLFIVGFGGSLANAEHMACDLRKLCEIEAYAPNVAEMSAWMNDAGEGDTFSGHLWFSNSKDALFVLSVGGGTMEVSKGLTIAVGALKDRGIKVFGIVGPHGGFTAQKGDIVIKVPATERITPHTEAFQAVLWHLLVSHPLLQKKKTKW